jgi:regulator of protease activity HflC (stomatin/prohibitin superfamily)
MVATSQIAQTTLRPASQHHARQLLSDRDKINAILQEIIDEQTAPWGIKVSVVEVKDVEIPRACSARWREPSKRERRPKVINAEASSGLRAATTRR